jgi:hypothetical protein
MKSIGIKEEIKKYKGNSRNQSGIKKIQQIKEGIKVEFKNLQINLKKNKNLGCLVEKMSQVLR